MTTPRHVAVVDIGKTNAKVAMVDLDTRTEIASRRQPNKPLAEEPYPHHDIDALWTFILDGLAALGREHPVDAISVTTHGATAALVDETGELVLPVLDYESDGPDRLRDAYEPHRPAFAETGSPKLPMGLNLGAQLFWLQETFPDAFARTHAILAYPQFWSAKLSGVFASEVTSLGCHTDLWNPSSGSFSSMVDALGWRRFFPPLRKASDVLGPLRAEIAARTGLDPSTPVLCGIHDSNASLLPHLLSRKPPFAVVSTGTWVVSMAVGAREGALDPARDTLVNVNAFGDRVPSARFMGGREFEALMAGEDAGWSGGDVERVLSERVMLLPSVQCGSGPFPNLKAEWKGEEPREGERFVAASFYLALMTATCLQLIGADGDVMVEGPLCSNAPYVSMLEHAAGRRVFIPGKDNRTGTSIGAALLAGKSLAGNTEQIENMLQPSAASQYAARWQSEVDDRLKTPAIS